MDPKRMSKHSFTVAELINTYFRGIFTSVLTLWDSLKKFESGPWRWNSIKDVVLLEECGSWFQQQSWTDDGGIYLQIRRHPIWEHLEFSAEIEAYLIDGFKALFPQKEILVVRSDYHRTTIYVKTSSVSIGDLHEEISLTLLTLRL